MDGLEASVRKMREEGIADPAIHSFAHYYRLLSEGETGMLPESALAPLEDVPDADKLPQASWPDDPRLEWAPPGHGDLYTSLVTSGMLAELLEHGYEFAFVANSDNLGAVLEPRILSWFAREELPFAMEVADRTQADRKGGHPARLRAGGLVL